LRITLHRLIVLPIVLCLAGAVATGCANDAPQSTAPSSSRPSAAQPAPGTTSDDLPDALPTSDGQADAPQEVVRSGPSVQYGGPAYGDQGTEPLSEGVWCDTVIVFWDGEVPSDVTFTFETAVVDHPGLSVAPAVCGTKGADRSCLSLTVAGGEAQTCSLALTPGDDFVDGTLITFDGTLRCPSVQVCDAVGARVLTQDAPRIIVHAPAEP
jgi:hypothetical protein